MTACKYKWFVLYTKPNASLKVADRLSALGIQVYTPTKIEVRQWSDRKKKIKVPFLPSMVLVRLEENNINNVFQVPGVVRYMFEHGKRVEIKEQEIEAMQLYVEGKAKVAKSVRVGDIVQIPKLQEKATVVALQGKKCLARLARLGAVVSFQLQ